MKNNKSRPTPKRKKAAPSLLTVTQEDTLLHFLLDNLPRKGRKLLKAVLRDGQVSVGGRVTTQFDQPLKPGQEVSVSWKRSAPQQEILGLTIIHEDDDIIIIDKPSGLLTIATEKEKRKTAYSILSNYVKKQDSNNKIFVVHRLDRETSGLLMFAKNEVIKKTIQATWKSTIHNRTYVAVVEGIVEPSEGVVESYLAESKAFIVYSGQNPKHGRKAITHYRKIDGNSGLSLLKVNLETGRKHQIRVHMQDINHPVIGDRKYGSTINPINRMGLHAQVLVFNHPVTGERCEFRTPVPKSFQNLFKPGKTS